MIINYLIGRRASFFETFRMAKYLFTKDFKNYVKILGFIFLPINFLLAVVNMFTMDVMSGFDLNIILQSPEKLTAFMSSAEYALINRYNFIIMIIELFFVPLATIAVSLLVYNYCYGKTEVPFKDVLIDTISKGSTLIFATIIYILLLAVGFMFFIIPGLILVVFLSFYIQCIGLKNDGPLRCIKSSFKMVGKRWLGLAVKFIGFYFINVIITYGVTILLGFMATNLFTSVIVTTIASIGQIIYAICLALVFLNIETGGYLIKDKNESNEFEQ